MGRKLFGVVKILLQRKLVDTLEGFTRYVDRVVKFFYANITDECLDENSFMFRKVYVRGSWYSFSPKDVANALTLPSNVEPADVPFDSMVVFAELACDPNIKLTESMNIFQLTYQHTVLIRFALSIWFPCSDAINVSNELAFLMFKITTSAQVDLEDVIYEQIMSLHKGK